MPNIGFPEFIILVPIFLFSAALPVVSFILVFLTYRKVSAIEQRLAQLEPKSPA